MMFESETTIYEIAFSYLIELQAHSLNNIGNKGSNVTYPRRQLLAYGIETDAVSGDMWKHNHADVLKAYFMANGVHLCSACARGDGRRALAASEIGDESSLKDILKCGICDVHGFLIPARKANGPGERDRRGQNKTSILRGSPALAIPESFSETTQLFTRRGVNSDEQETNGQMIFKIRSRSGAYAMCLRYICALIGADSDTFRLVITDPEVRRLRHRLVLEAIRDQVLNPGGALTSRMLPHYGKMTGAIVVRLAPGRAPMYSPLEADFVDELERIAKADSQCKYMRFNSASEFTAIMSNLAEFTKPFGFASQSEKQEGQRED